MVTCGETVTRQACCRALNVGLRRCRDLIKAGRLVTSGAGHNSRITTESLNAELSRRRNSEVSAEKSGIMRKDPKSLPHFFQAPLEAKTKPVETVLMQAMNANRTATELLPISRAAARVGLSDRVMLRAVETGAIPVVVVGDRRWINSKELADWARGSILGGNSSDQEQE